MIAKIQKVAMIVFFGVYGLSYFITIPKVDVAPVLAIAAIVIAVCLIIE